MRMGMGASLSSSAQAGVLFNSTLRGPQDYSYKLQEADYLESHNFALNALQNIGDGLTVNLKFQVPSQNAYQGKKVSLITFGNVDAYANNSFLDMGMIAVTSSRRFYVETTINGTGYAEEQISNIMGSIWSATAWFDCYWTFYKNSATEVEIKMYCRKTDPTPNSGPTDHFEEITSSTFSANPMGVQIGSVPSKQQFRLGISPYIGLTKPTPELGSGSNTHFTGKYDDIKIWNNVLSASTIEDETDITNPAYTPYTNGLVFKWNLNQSLIDSENSRELARLNYDGDSTSFWDTQGYKEHLETNGF
tara:strand:+ start:1656 stop:2570 length:915 start_codon:yes stop_codon:yes gene_type:complete